MASPIARPIARVMLYDSFAAAEPVWRAFQRADDSVLSPYQQFDFLHAWHTHVGARRGVTPLIAIAFDALKRPLCLLPLGRRDVAGVTIAEFLAGKHANFNAPIWQQQMMLAADATSLEPLFEAIAPFVDALVLLNQPRFWNGVPNPLTFLPHSDSAEPACSGTLDSDFEALLKERMSTLKRKKLRNRQRVLAQFGELRLERATQPGDIDRILRVFHEQKAHRFAELGIGNAFAEPGVEAFIAEIAHNSRAEVELYALYAGEHIVATCAGMVTKGRFSTMFNSITRDEMANGSPGKVLLLKLIESLCARGVKTFDLGVGEAQYKEVVCNDLEPLFDSFLPLSPAGRMIAGAMRAAGAAKRTIKHTPALWSAVQTARRWRSRIA